MTRMNNRLEEAAQNWDNMLRIFTQEQLIIILRMPWLNRLKKRARKKRFKQIIRRAKLYDLFLIFQEENQT